MDLLLSNKITSYFVHKIKTIVVDPILYSLLSSVGPFTFTRLGEQSFSDYEDTVKKVETDIPSFVGTRQVENELRDRALNYWVATSGATFVDNGDGSIRATLPAGGGVYKRTSSLKAAGSEFRLSSEALHVSGSTNDLRIQDSGGYTGILLSGINELIGDEYVRISPDTGTLIQDATVGVWWRNAGTTEIVFDIRNTQIEDVTGEINKNPSEFVVDTGHFTTLNGNTVDVNGLVTESTGAEIVGSGGVLLEGVGTNKLLYSEDFTDAEWNKATTTVELASVEAPDGTLTAFKVSGSGYLAAQGTSLPGDNKSIWARTVTGTGFANVLVHNGNNKLTELTEVWKRISFNYEDDANFPSNFYAADLRSGDLTEFYIWGAQLEAKKYYTSYTKTSGTTVTRSATSLTASLSTIGVPNLRNNFSGQIKVRPQFDYDDARVNFSRPLAIESDDGAYLLAIIFNPASDRVYIRMDNNGIVSETSYLVGSINYARDELLNIRFSKNNSSGLKMWINNITPVVNGDTSAKTDYVSPLTKVEVGSGLDSEVFESIVIHPTALSDIELEALT